MSKKSGVERAAGAVHHSKALKDIIKAFTHGGWGAAAVQTLKHYWPQILTAALILLFIPVIVFCSLPMMMFGFESSTDTEVSSMTVQADTVSSEYDSYADYINEYIEEIKDSATTDSATSSSDSSSEAVTYETVIDGELIQKNWFIVLHSVSVENDLNSVSEQSVKDFAKNCVEYSFGEAETGVNEERVKKLMIHHRTADEIMDALDFSEADRNWIQLIHKTLDGKKDPVVGELDSLFDGDNWREHITSRYGYRSAPEFGFHHGIDIAEQEGTEILAVRDGTVKASSYSEDDYGYYIIIDHGEGVETLYAHCSELLAEKGQEVTKGDVIAKVGSTGDSTGPHCHFEIRIDQKAVDPLPYLS